MFLGDGAVGKSSMIIQYKEKSFEDDHKATLGIDYITKKHQMDGVDYTVKIWDTAGQERFRTMTQTFYKRAHGVIIVFDVTDKSTFDSVENWIKSIADNAAVDIQKILVGNKIDLVDERVVSLQEA